MEKDFKSNLLKCIAMGYTRCSINEFQWHSICSTSSKYQANKIISNQLHSNALWTLKKEQAFSKCEISQMSPIPIVRKKKQKARESQKRVPLVNRWRQLAIQSSTAHSRQQLQTAISHSESQYRLDFTFNCTLHCRLHCIVHPIVHNIVHAD